MHPRRFAHPNNVSHQNHWRPSGPRFSPMWPMQPKYRPNSNGQNFPNTYENHWCETCDRGFRTLEELLNHKQQHQKCNIDGCQFIAHPKIITKHIQMQHSTGLYKKIAKLDNPEEIQKWREERKKRYPTKENIEKRNAEIKEKIDRGEKMGMRSHRINKPIEREQGRKRKYNHDINGKNFKRRFQTNNSSVEVKKKINNTLIDDNKKLMPQKENKSVCQVDSLKTLKPFTGILNLRDDTNDENDRGDTEIHDSIEDDEYITMDESDDKNNSLLTEPVVCGALSSLICNYESSDEETVHKSTQLQHNESINIKTKNNFIEQNVNSKPNECLKNNINNIHDSGQSDDDSGPEEAKIVKGNNTEKNNEVSINCNTEQRNLAMSKRERQEKARPKTYNTTITQKKFKPKLPSTLLEKLLCNEIRQERNIVLQCIRYIVKNNYFDKV